jgi:hypothetical protein
MAGWLERRYGAGPLHLLSLLVAAPLMAYGVLQWARMDAPLSVAVWFVGAILLHDLVLYPAYTALDRAAQLGVRGRRERPAAVALLNHVRIPLLLSLLALLVWFPLILDRAPGAFERKAGIEPEPYARNWLLLTAALFVASALVLVARRAMGGATGGGARAAAGDAPPRLDEETPPDPPPRRS